jgi:HSP90 family molecular chaperone
MNISNIGSNFGIDSLTPTPSTAAQVPATDATSTTASTQLSPMATLLNQLQKLQQSDPSKFKSVMSSIADALKGDAQNATGQQAQRLNDLADKFSQAAQTGQMPDLQPPGQQQGAAGHAHHHRVQSYQEGANATTGGQKQARVDLAQILQTALQDAGE